MSSSLIISGFRILSDELGLSDHVTLDAIWFFDFLNAQLLSDDLELLALLSYSISLNFHSIDYRRFFPVMSTVLCQDRELEDEFSHVLNRIQESVSLPQSLSKTCLTVAQYCFNIGLVSRSQFCSMVDSCVAFAIFLLSRDSSPTRDTLELGVLLVAVAAETMAVAGTLIGQEFSKEIDIVEFLAQFELMLSNFKVYQLGLENLKRLKCHRHRCEIIYLGQLLCRFYSCFFALYIIFSP
ncbi:hypothetical protein GEMRC1_011906 [Eukaryota sp. GEM-RC1]